jgi:hypothetical protein
VGRVVEISWKDENFDWRFFYVVSCDGRLATLRGVADKRDGIPHDGSSFEANWNEVCDICLSGDAGYVGRVDSSYSELIENPGVLGKAKALVDGRDKQDHYGPPEEFMGRLAKMWGGYLGLELKATDAALMMALLKAARLRTNPEHEDSLVDLAGYIHIYERMK